MSEDKMTCPSRSFLPFLLQTHSFQYRIDSNFAEVNLFPLLDEYLCKSLKNLICMLVIHKQTFDMHMHQHPTNLVFPSESLVLSLSHPLSIDALLLRDVFSSSILIIIYHASKRNVRTLTADRHPVKY